MSVLVTGASRGIGAGILEAMDPAGLRFGTCRPQTSCPEDDGVGWIKVDLQDEEAEATIIAALRSTPGFTGLSGLVLNAGVALPESFSREAGDAHLALDNLYLNLLAPLRLIHALLAQGCMAPKASVVLIGSNLARRGLAGKVCYSAAKAGLEGATRALAKELGPLGIRVNTVAPGLVLTDMTRGLGDEFLQGYRQEVPLRREGSPADIAAVVRFFLSEEAGYVTGQVLDVDGGWGA